MIITPDTSISHIASAFNTPVVTIHENNIKSYELFAPKSKINKTFFSKESNSLIGYDIDALINYCSKIIKKMKK
jgi:ADP-heptose:LPS heptosyltransferase